MTQREMILAEIAQLIDETTEKAEELQEKMREFWDETAYEPAQKQQKPAQK